MTKSSDSKSRPDNPDFSDLLVLLGANLRAARLKLGLTQARLAEQSGLLQQYVSLVESRKQNVTLMHWESPRLCRGGSRSLTFPEVVPGYPLMKL